MRLRKTDNYSIRWRKEQMKIKQLNNTVSVSDQLVLDDLHELKRLGVTTIVCNRPDAEQEGQTDFSDIQNAASLLRMDAIHLPFTKEDMRLEDIDQLANLLAKDKKIHAYCRSGQRSSMLWSLAAMKLGYQEEAIIVAVDKAGYKLNEEKLNGLVEKKLIEDVSQSPLKAFRRNRMEYFDVVIVGGGSAGISLCASLLKRDKSLSIAIIEPKHGLYYQPGWTMVGGGVFDIESTQRLLEDFIPEGVTWIKNEVEQFFPNRHMVQLHNTDYIHYQQLVIATGLELHWQGIEGLQETLGKNGVTSNYRFDLASYTWGLVKDFRNGKAIFTQPPMPIKCAGAPQKAMYLSADHWLKNDMLSNIDISFYSAGESIFGVPVYVPALEAYLEKYAVDTQFQHNLVKVDGENQIAYFSTVDAQDQETVVEKSFDMLHVCPPQRAPKVIRDSSLCDKTGWLDVDQHSLVHCQYNNIWGLGDVINTPNAKTLAAVRKQVPVVAENLINGLKGKPPSVTYNGYGSCPLTVERGKIVLAEFVYGGKHSPTFPQWLNDGTKPTRFAWLLKKLALPWVYWHLMLKGIEWFARPKR